MKEVLTVPPDLPEPVLWICSSCPTCSQRHYDSVVCASQVAECLVLVRPQGSPDSSEHKDWVEVPPQQPVLTHNVVQALQTGTVL